MSGLRTLALCYLTAVSAFGLAAVLQSRPDLAAGVDDAARLADRHVRRPVLAYAARAQAALTHLPDLFAPPFSDARVMIALAPPDPNEDRLAAHYAPPALAPRELEEVTPDGAALAPIIIAPDLPPVAREAPVAPRAARPAPPGDQAAAQLPSIPAEALAPEQRRALARLSATLTPEMRTHFGLFIFVSKAVKGPLAQRMYVFRKEGADLKLVYDWAASTGREKDEVDPGGRRTFTATPGGLYQLDPGRMFVRYRSYTWDQPMPYAMFFNWQRKGMQTGLAIHAASGDDIARLGQRASAGCVHLAPENARTLFNLIQGQYRGSVPRFAINGEDTMSNTGRFARAADGAPRMTQGYRVLIDIEDYGGVGEDKVASLF